MGQALSDNERNERMAADWNDRAATEALAWRYILDRYDGNKSTFYASGLKHWEDMRIAMRHFGVWPPRGNGVYAAEIGCGVGRMTVHMASDFFSLDALDVSANMIAYAPPMPNVTYRVAASLDSVPYLVDYVLSFIVFQHMPKGTFWRYLVEAEDLLSNGGIFCTQMHLGSADFPDGETLFCRGYTPEDFANLSPVWERIAIMEQAPGTSEGWYWLILRRKPDDETIND